MTPSTDLASQISQGRAVGYSDDEMLDFLSKRPELGQKIATAKQAGYGSGEILNHLAPNPSSQPQRQHSPGLKQTPNETPGPEDSAFGQAVLSPYASIGHGISRAANAPDASEVAGGVSDVARGLMGAVGPALLPGAMMAAPVATGAGIVAGGLAGGAAERGLRNAGVRPGYAELGGDIAGAGAGIGAGMGASAGTQAAFRINPEVAAERAWRPTPQDSQFPAVTPSAGSDVKTYGNPGVRTNADTIPAAKAAVDHLQRGMETYLTRAEQAGVQIPGNILVQATHQAIPDLMWQQDPQSSQALVDSAQRAFGGKYFDVGRWRNWLKTENANLSQFYSQAGAKQGAGVTGGTPPGIESAQAAAMREALYQYLSPEDQGAGPREIQERTGNVIGLRNAADRASNRVTGEHAISPAEGFGKALTGAARVVGAPFQHGDVPGAMRQVMNPMQGPTDALVGQFYEAVPHAGPIPQPQAAQHPLGSGTAQRQLPAPMRMGGAPDGSYVSARQGMYPAGPNPARALPAPGMVTPPPADTSAVASSPAMYPTGPNPARALPPARTFIVPPADASGPHPSTSSSPMVSPSGPTYGVTPDSIATKLGKSVRSFLGDPTVK